MDPFDYIVPALFLLFAGFFAFRVVRYGSLTGALLDGHIIRTVGEVSLAKTTFSCRVLKVQIMETAVGEKPSVALSIVSKAPLAASTMPFKLSAAQAEALAQLLLQASSGRAVS
jgi:hypothetical protein